MSKWVEFPIAPQDLLNPQMKGRKPLYVHQHPQLGAEILYVSCMFSWEQQKEVRYGQIHRNIMLKPFGGSIFLVYFCLVPLGGRMYWPSLLPLKSEKIPHLPCAETLSEVGCLCSALDGANPSCLRWWEFTGNCREPSTKSNLWPLSFRTGKFLVLNHWKFRIIGISTVRAPVGSHDEC